MTRLSLPSYEIWLTTDAGVQIQPLSTIVGLKAGRESGKIGWMDLYLPPSFNTSLISVDKMIQIWRKPRGGALSLWRPYFIRKWRYETRGSEETIKISGPDCNDLLRRRIVAAYTGSTEASKTDYADDMMKEVVTQSIADGVDPTPAAGTRVWSDFTIAGDLSDGPSVSRSFPFDRLLLPSGGGALPTIAKASREAAFEVFYDVEVSAFTNNSIAFQFRTYTGQPGTDQTGGDIIFDQDQGNMKNPFIEFDWSDEVNYVYSGGQGMEDNRNVQQAYDDIRYGLSKWNRCEGFIDARNQTNDISVTNAAQAGLVNGRPNRKFSAEPMDTEATRFGIEWNYGDKVRARYRGYEFDTIIRAVTLSINDKGKETISTKLEYEE